ncbi:hypothetical protein [Sorangium sp. So ce394]|uniref:hypothetical protein n=1 Tax=Sorangium sp. So ce394 TaxID=3133310 RepID=UPI003F5AE15A
MRRSAAGDAQEGGRAAQQGVAGCAGARRGTRRSAAGRRSRASRAAQERGGAAQQGVAGCAGARRGTRRSAAGRRSRDGRRQQQGGGTAQARSLCAQDRIRARTLTSRPQRDARRTLRPGSFTM